MKRSAIFGALSAPSLVWPSIVFWAQSKATASAPDAGNLSLAVRTALFLNNWSIRLLPFVVIILILVWPLIVLGIAVLTGASASRNTATRRDVLFWWCVSAATFGALFAVFATAYYLDVDFGPSTISFASLLWPGVMAFWISLAAAYSVQQKRRLVDPNAWEPKWFLAALAALNCFGIYAVPVLAAVAFGRDAPGQEKAG